MEVKKIYIGPLLQILLALFFFFFGLANGQDFITTENFEDKIAKDIVAVEFWADWNKHNQFAELNKLKECEAYRLDIMAEAEIQAKYNITAIPTVVIFDNGVEKCRFGANIMFQLEADKKTIQNSVDTIILNKFQ